ncbi:MULTISPECIES: ribonuclease [Glaesserella]|uniref:Ribonuclease n=1 Tax=Glaesserella australis TaxID=2094024 RepID=A0A328C1I8_9PAST|nr:MULTISPECIES: ribonuclease [Glaesserella]AUI66978.1 ribonuclease [Glaesserella sp. 15-184]RAL18930.1 ribonuclease [Glaesserella australis]
MKPSKNPKNRTIQQLIALVVIGIFAVVTWFNNEQKASKESESKPAITKSSEPNNTTAQPTTKVDVPSQLGNYDTNMARDNLGQNKNASVDYYMLALSWSPSFCENQRNKNNGEIPQHLAFQCNQAAQLGWVIHGLWPQSATARDASDHPRFCQGDLPKLPESLIKQYMPESPGASLLQGQWEKHGACAFNSAEDYFAKQKQLFRSLNLPGQELSRKELFAWMKKFNPQLKDAYLGASKNELYICYDKSWNVMDCPR